MPWDLGRRVGRRRCTAGLGRASAGGGGVGEARQASGGSSRTAQGEAKALMVSKEAEKKIRVE